MCVDFVAGEGINFGSKISEFSILEGIKMCADLAVVEGIDFRSKIFRRFPFYLTH